MSRRHVLLGLTLCCVLFALYGSLVPLDFRSVPLDVAVRALSQTPYMPFSRTSGSDVLTNVLLFVPIGFFALGSISGRSRWLSVALLLPSAALSALVSVGIEFSQIFTIGRTPSWTDVESQILGYLGGGLGWLMFGESVVDWASSFFRTDSKNERVYRLLVGYTALWVVLGLLPFDFTIRPQELAEKFRDGRVVLEPFSAASTLRGIGGTVLLAMPLGAFGVMAGLAGGWSRPALAGIVIGLSVTAGMEGVQLLSVSRTADITDVLSGSIGVLMGVVLATRWHGVTVPESGSRVRLWPLGALVVWTLLLIVRHWSPFDFVVDGEFVRRRLPGIMAVPFHSYYLGLAPSVLVDATTKLLMGIPVGVFLQLLWRPEDNWWRRVAATLAGTVAAAIFLVLELGQLLLPSRVPDQTDVYIGTLGAMAGIALINFVTRRPSTQPAANYIAASRPPPSSGRRYTGS